NAATRCRPKHAENEMMRCRSERNDALSVRSYPALRAVVFDLPEAVPLAGEGVAASPVGDRIEVVTGDFFVDPLPEGDLFALARASYEAIEAALKSMRRQADREGITSITMPKVGAGYGGLSWNKVREIIEKVFADWRGSLFVYEEYATETEGATGKSTEATLPIHVESRRKKRATLERAWPDALILDVTSKGEQPWVRFSPFYPHGGIPVPNTPGTFARSGDGLWQGLKVFEHEDIDPSRWQIDDMKGIKRGGDKRGKILGHRFGVGSPVLLSYRDARYRIYLPAYRWVLENRLAAEVARLRNEMASSPLVLLDYETNGNVEDLSRPLSHAALIKLYLEDAWPGVK